MMGIINRIIILQEGVRMVKNEQAYLDLCQHVLTNGVKKEDRTGTGTISVFGHQMRFNLQDGFPLLTTKRVPFRLIASELLWFINGDTNIKFLLQHNNNIWNDIIWSYKRFIFYFSNFNK